MKISFITSCSALVVLFLLWIGIRGRFNKGSNQLRPNAGLGSLNEFQYNAGTGTVVKMAASRVLVDVSSTERPMDYRQIAQLRVQRLNSFDCPDYLSISSNLVQAGVNVASAALITPRVYADLLRIKLFEEILHNYEDRLTNNAALEAMRQPDEMKEVYKKMQEAGFSTWSKIVSNQSLAIVNRLEDEAGIRDSATKQRILELRPNGIIPDLSMTNGILYE